MLILFVLRLKVVLFAAILKREDEKHTLCLRRASPFVLELLISLSHHLIIAESGFQNSGRLLSPGVGDKQDRQTEMLLHALPSRICGL